MSQLYFIINLHFETNFLFPKSDQHLEFLSQLYIFFQGLLIERLKLIFKAQDSANSPIVYSHESKLSTKK